MVVGVFETNLLWSARLVLTLQTHGHTARVLAPGEDWTGIEAAVLNLGESAYGLAELVPALHAAGVRTVAHAGHREKDLLALGREYGVTRVATNREISERLPVLLEAAL